VVPKCCLTSQFPWQKVSLLVEYEHTVDITLPSSVPSLEHVMLKCVSHSFPGLSGEDINLTQGAHNCYILFVVLCSKHEIKYIMSHNSGSY